MDFDDIDKKLINCLASGLPFDIKPYHSLAERFDMTEEEVLDRMQRYKENGLLYTVRALLNHDLLGHEIGALVLWEVVPEQIDLVGEYMAQFSEITHCYEREVPADTWRYNLYTTVHAVSREACLEFVERVSKTKWVQCYHILFTEREIKKTPMQYFSSAESEENVS